MLYKSSYNDIALLVRKLIPQKVVMQPFEDLKDQDWMKVDTTIANPNQEHVSEIL